MESRTWSAAVSRLWRMQVGFQANTRRGLDVGGHQCSGSDEGSFRTRTSRPCFGGEPKTLVVHGNRSVVELERWRPSSVAPECRVITSWDTCTRWHPIETAIEIEDPQHPRRSTNDPRWTVSMASDAYTVTNEDPVPDRSLRTRARFSIRASEATTA